MCQGGRPFDELHSNTRLAKMQREVAYGKEREQERNDLLFALENKQANRS